MSEKALVDAYTDLYCSDPECIYPCAAERNALQYIKEIKAAAWQEGSEDGKYNKEYEHMISYGMRTQIQNPYL